jgi:hypothetical protein
MGLAIEKGHGSECVGSAAWLLGQLDELDRWAPDGETLDDVIGAARTRVARACGQTSAPLPCGDAEGNRGSSETTIRRHHRVLLHHGHLLFADGHTLFWSRSTSARRRSAEG